MKSLKKILSLLLVMAMLLTAMPAQWIFAVETADPQIVVGSASVNVAEGAATCVIPVEIKNNPGFATFTIQASIPEGWSLITTDADGDEFECEDYYIQDNMNNFSILCLTFPVPGMGNMATGINGNFVANLANGTLVCAKATDYTGDGKLFFLTYSVPQGIANGDYPITLEVKELASVNAKYTDVVTVEAGKVNVSGGVEELNGYNTTISGIQESYEFTGEAIEPTPVVNYNGKVLAASNYEVSYNNNTNVGVATLTVTGKGSYQGSVSTVFQITKKAAAITVAEDLDATYGDDDVKLNATVNSGAALSYASDNANVVTVDPDGTVSIMGAGEAVITVTAPETENYTAASAKVNVSVAKAQQEVTVEAVDAKTYGDDAFTLAADAETKLSFSSNNDQVASVNKEGEVTIKGVGTAVITVEAAETTNFEGASATVTVTVGQKEVSVSGITVEDKQYDGTTAATIASTGAIDGIVGQDDLTVTVTGEFEDANVGTDKTVELNVTLSGNQKGNYVLSAESQSTTTASITEADAVEGLTAKVTRRYDNKDAITLTAEELKELMPADAGELTLSGWTVQEDKDGILVKSGDSYKLYDGAKPEDEGKTAVLTATISSDNYADSTVTVTVEVMDKIDVSANITFEGGSAVYNGKEHSHETAKYNGAAADLKYVYEGDRVNAGSFTVTAIYEDEMSYGEKTVTFTIEKAKLTVTGAAVATKEFDGSVAANVETVTFSAELTADDYEVTAAEFDNVNVGSNKKVTYTVTLKDTETTKNYTLTNGTNLTAKGAIEALEIDVTVAVKGEYTYTGSKQEAEVEVTAAGTIAGYDLTDDDYKVAYANNTNAGEAEVTVSAKTGSNYTFETVTETFVIEKAEPTRASASASKVYDGKAIDDSDIEGTAYFGSKKIQGEWSFVEAQTATDAATYENVEVVFTPAESETNFLPIVIEIDVEIEKAEVTIDEDDLDASEAETVADVIEMLEEALKGTALEGAEITVYNEDDEEIKDGATELSNGMRFVVAGTDNYESFEYVYEENNGSNGLLIGAILAGAAGGMNFDDVAGSDWFYDAVDFVVEEGLFEGISEDEFRPEGSMTRAMLVTVLWRLEGEPNVYGYADFEDVARGEWYTGAVAWAAANGIVNGVSETKFDPNASITREQMAAMLYRYAAYLGLDVTADVDLTMFADAADVSDYAKEAMAWAVSYGFIQGMNADTLAPQGTATRAQVATILMRFVEWFDL